MRRVAIINQKGGVGKTTTTVNVGMGLARAGYRVLLIDLDPQAHLSLHLGVDPAAGRPGVYELLTGSGSIAKARVKAGNNLWVVSSSIDLAAAEVELVGTAGREVILRNLLDQHVKASSNGRSSPYDYVLMDCPPSLGILTLNALCAAREVLIPLQPHYLALQGLGKLLETISLITKGANPDLTVAGVVICLQDAGTKLGAEVIEDVRSFFENDRGKPVPWSAARVFGSIVRRNIKLAESPSYGQSIYDYAPDSNGARDYEQLVREIIGEPAAASLTLPQVASAETALPVAEPAPMTCPAVSQPPSVTPSIAEPVSLNVVPAQPVGVPDHPAVDVPSLPRRKKTA